MHAVADHPLWGAVLGEVAAEAVPGGGTELVLNKELSPGRAPAYQRLKVKVKAELIALDLTTPLDLTRRGTEIPPAEWDSAIVQPGVLLIDVRNEFETQLGSFRGAVPTPTSTFREFPRWADETLRRTAAVYFSLFGRFFAPFSPKTGAI